ncbi:hypothetical protein NFI96_013686 [Prochilodus magdalenae]|nr:hypothetical protein NFI96_013686 [Prochilodus magdalenae]
MSSQSAEGYGKLSVRPLTDCHGVTQNGSGSSSVTSPALVLVETPNRSLYEGTVVSAKMNGWLSCITCPEGLVSLHLHPYRTICAKRTRRHLASGRMAEEHPPSCSTAVLHVAIALLAFLSSCNATTPSRDPDIPANAQYFNTKTRYQDVDIYLREDILAINISAVKPPAPACVPIHFTIIARHGTRFPTAENIKKISAFDELVKTEAKGDLRYLPELKAWKMWYKEEMAGLLTATGRADHRHLAQRMVETFPSLLTKKNLLGGRVKFITSSESRCVSSTLAFQEGLKEQFHIEGQEFPYTVNDTLMRFSATCARLVETVLDNPEASIEATRFKNGSEMKRLREKLADLLQIPYASVTTDSVETGFYLCAYEFTIRRLNSPWCRLFDRADAQVIDYASDLDLYYKRGYGHKINSMASCVLFNDLFDRLETAATEFR